MTQQFVNAVQYPMVFTGLITSANVGAGNEAFIDVPAGFVYTGGAMVVTQAFNGTTPAMSIVDNMTTPNTMLASTALTATGPTALAAGELYNYYPAGARFAVALTGSGSTAGGAAVLIQGVVLGRQNERVGAT